MKMKVNKIALKIRIKINNKNNNNNIYAFKKIAFQYYLILKISKNKIVSLLK